MRKPLNSSVTALPAVDLPGVGIAATAGLGNLITGSRNEIWLCPGFHGDAQPVMLYVKLGLSERAIFIEILAAQLAHALRLPCPTPFLVTVSPHHVGRPRGAQVLAFGSQDVSERSMARPVRALEVLMDLLERAKLDDMAGVFDEWIANDVRSPSDVLVSPEGGMLYLIDHEAAMRDGLAPDATITNWLVSRLVERCDADSRVDLLRRLRARLTALQRVRLAQAPAVAQYSQDGVMLYTSLVQFITDRLQHLDRLLSERVMPEQLYLAAPATQQQPSDHAPLRTSDF